MLTCEGDGIVGGMQSILLLAAAGAAAEAPLEPTGKWVVDFAEQQCAASRGYRDGDSEVTLVLRQSPYDDLVHLFIIRPGRVERWAEQFPAELVLGSGTSIKTHLIRSGVTKAKAHRRLYRLSLDQDQLGQLVNSGSIEIRSGGLPNTRFELPQMPAVAKMLNDCTHDLRKYWNLGEASAVIATPSKATKEVRLLFTANDYPAVAISGRQEGSAQLMLLIDEKGAMRTCDVVNAKGAPVFEAMGCQVLLQRASFLPALDRNGKPVRSGYITPPIVWRLL